MDGEGRKFHFVDEIGWTGFMEEGMAVVPELGGGPEVQEGSGVYHTGTRVGGVEFAVGEPPGMQ